MCLTLTAFNSIDSCDLKSGEWICIVGCGGLGQYAVQYAKAMGLKVIGMDVNDAMLEEAKKVGADAVFNTLKYPDYAKEIKKLTDGGAHAAAVYSNATPAYQSATTTLRVNGLLMVVGLPVKPLEFPAFDICVMNYRVRGESTGIPQRMPKAVEFTAKHQIIPDVDFRKLEEMPQMVEEMDAGKASKRMVVLF